MDISTTSPQPDIEPANELVSLDVSVTPEPVAQSSEDVSTALLAKAFGSASSTFGANEAGTAAIDNNQHLDASFWSLRRLNLAVRAMLSPLTNGENNIVGRDERTLDMLNKEAYDAAMDLKRLNKSHEPTATQESANLQKKILTILDGHLEKNVTLTDLEKDSIRDIAKLALSDEPNDENKKQKVYSQLNDKSYEKVRNDTADRWYHGFINAGVSGTTKFLSIVSAPFTGGFGGIAIGTAVETAALHTSTYVMEEKAVRRSEEQRKAAIDGIVQAFHQSADPDSGEAGTAATVVPPHVDRFEKALLAYNENADQDNMKNLLTSATELVGTAARLKEMVESGEATLSAATYKGYQAIMDAGQAAMEKTREHFSDQEGNDLISYSKYLSELSSRIKIEPTETQSFIDTVRATEHARIETFTDQSLENVRKEVLDPARLLKTAVVSGFGNSCAVVSAGLSHVGEQFQGVQAIGVDGNYMKLGDHVVEVAQKTLTQHTGLPDWATKPIADMYGAITKNFNEHVIGGGTQAFLDRFKIDGTQAEAIGKAFDIESFDPQGVITLYDNSVVQLANHADSIKALAEKGFQQVRFYNFDAHAQYYQAAADCMGALFQSAMATGMGAQIITATGGVDIKGPDRGKLKIPKLVKFPQIKRPVRDHEGDEPDEQEGPTLSGDGLRRLEQVGEHDDTTRLGDISSQDDGSNVAELAAQNEGRDIQQLVGEEYTRLNEIRLHQRPDDDSYTLRRATDSSGSTMVVAQSGLGSTGEFFIGEIVVGPDGRPNQRSTFVEIETYDEERHVIAHKLDVLDYLEQHPDEIRTLLQNGEVNVEHTDSNNNSWTVIKAAPINLSESAVAPVEMNEFVEESELVPVHPVPAKPDQEPLEVPQFLVEKARANGHQNVVVAKMPEIVGREADDPDLDIPDFLKKRSRSVVVPPQQALGDVVLPGIDNGTPAEKGNVGSPDDSQTEPVSASTNSNMNPTEGGSSFLKPGKEGNMGQVHTKVHPSEVSPDDSNKQSRQEDDDYIPTDPEENKKFWNEMADKMDAETDALNEAERQRRKNEGAFGGLKRMMRGFLGRNEYDDDDFSDVEF